MTLLQAPPQPLTEPELAQLNREFETASASEIISWVVERYAPYICLTASMTDAVMIDLATRVYPAIEVVFIDTGYHFPETLATVEAVRRHYGLNLKIMTVKTHSEQLWLTDPENCCSAVKVGQLDRALHGKLAWMSGLRRAESESRAQTPIVLHDLRGLVKVNPIANWTNEQVDAYIEENDVPCNPLLQQGYPSIGCQPCTKPVEPGSVDLRGGRWAGKSKTECGLHG